MFYWFLLFIAVFTEVMGTISIKYAGEYAGLIHYFILFSLIGLSYYFFSKAIQGIPLGLAYAVWEGVGLIMMLILGYFLFDEIIHKQKLLACGIVVVGMVMLNLGRANNSQRNG